jgi:hypothetical protein
LERHRLRFFEEAVDFNTGFVGAGKSQFYHPLVTSTDEPHDEPCIDWPAFPKLVKDRFPGNAKQAFDAAEGTPTKRERFQDEYLEWHVVRNSQNKITRVSFTCETTQYYDFLARTDPDALLEIYRSLVDPAHKNRGRGRRADRRRPISAEEQVEYRVWRGAPHSAEQQSVR